MTIGGSLLLVGVGAILKWAVTGTVKWIDIQTVGTIVFIVGLAGLVLSIVYTFYAAQQGGAVDESGTRVMRSQGRPRDY